VVLRVSIQESANHALVLSVVLTRLVLKEVDATLAQGNSDLNAFVPEHKILGPR